MEPAADDVAGADKPPIECTDELSELLRRYDEARTLATQWTETVNELKGTISERLNAGPGRHQLTSGGQTVATFTVFERASFDTPKFRERWPDLYRQFCTPRAQTRLVVSKP